MPEIISRKRVLVTRDLPGGWIRSISQEGFSVDLWEGRAKIPREELLKRCRDKDGLLITLNERVDREVLDSCSEVKVISTYSVGYDHIDVGYAREKGVVVTHTPEVLTDSTADLVFALMLAVSRRVVEGDRIVREGKWETEWRPEFMLGNDVHHRTLGIIGMGRIGRAVAKRAQGFDMRVIFTSRSRHEIHNAEQVDMDTLLREADFVVVTVDLNRDTYHMMDYEKFQRMKRTAYFINASRGKVVDQPALYMALKEGLIAGAGLDVFETEPLPRDDPLVSLPNVVLTPHIGSATRETRERMAEVAVRNLILALKGERPLYPVP